MMVLSVFRHSNFARVVPAQSAHPQTYKRWAVHSGRLRELAVSAADSERHRLPSQGVPCDCLFVVSFVL